MVNLKHNELVKRTVLGVGKFVKNFSKTGPGIIILIYHSIAEEGSIVSVPPREFQNQIKWLVDNYRIVSLDEALTCKSINEDVLVLSFDDGYKDYLTEALPILQRYNVPSIVYVVTNLVQNPESGYQMNAGFGKVSLNPRDLEELAKEDLVTIGSHTHTHKNLTKLTSELLQMELETSYKYLREVLRYEKIHFSYPWALYNDQTTRMVKRLYKTAVIGKGRKNQLPLDFFKLMRIPIVNESLELFQERVKGNFLIEARIRECFIGS